MTGFGVQSVAFGVASLSLSFIRQGTMVSKVLALTCLVLVAVLCGSTLAVYRLHLPVAVLLALIATIGMAGLAGVMLYKHIPPKL
jgi:hypothetical protein